MKKVISRGFTLIELLVVIAIIGILASIVLVSLNSARSKGKDTRVLSDVNQIRTQLESDNTNGVYSDLWNTTTGGTNLAASLTTNGPGYTNICGSTAYTTCVISSLAGDAYAQNTTAVSIFIKTNSTTGLVTVANATAYSIYGRTSTGYYCVDSRGANVTNTLNVAIPSSVTAGDTCQ